MYYLLIGWVTLQWVDKEPFQQQQNVHILRLKQNITKCPLLQHQSEEYGCCQDDKVGEYHSHGLGQRVQC